MKRRGRPPRDREGEARRAEEALETWQHSKGSLWASRPLTPEERKELFSRLGWTPRAVEEVESIS
jgi:hypothetical protein